MNDGEVLLFIFGAAILILLLGIASHLQNREDSLVRLDLKCNQLERELYNLQQRIESLEDDLDQSFEGDERYDKEIPSLS